MSTPRDPGWKNRTHPVRELTLEQIKEYYRKKGTDNQWQKIKPK